MPNWVHVFWGACFWAYPAYVIANLHRLEVVKYDVYGNLIEDKAVAEYWWRYPPRNNSMK